MPTPKAFRRISTDETLQENVQHGSASFPLQYYYEDIWDFDFHCIDWHWHHELEYVYVKTGSAVCFVGGEKVVVNAGSGILINSRAVHRFEAAASTIIPNLVFSPELLAGEDSLLYQQAVRPVIKSGVSHVVLTDGVPWQEVCLRRMREVFSCMEKDEPDAMQIAVSMLLFWRELGSHLPKGEPRCASEQENTSHIRLQLMLQYIQEHYREKIRLEDIADAVHVGKSTMMQIFRRTLRISPVAYLIRYRLRKAAVLLRTTEKSVAVIADETGFESAAYFCRKFRENYQVTPMAYRRARG